MNVDMFGYGLKFVRTDYTLQIESILHFKIYCFLYWSKQGQVLSEILRDKTMADKSMYIPNHETQNYPVCRLQLLVETFEYST